MFQNIHTLACSDVQAQDRIHRLGQYKPIHVTRFVIGGTIEERILKLQVIPSLLDSSVMLLAALS